MDKIIFATGNQGKLREIRMILEGTGLEIISMKEAGVTGDIEENGTTFKENALIKAKAVCSMTGMPALADDSGLVIDALGGEPGIHSARYLGHDTSYDIKNNDLIRRLEGVPDEKRSARFVCAIACALPDGRTFTEEAAMEGRIGYEIRGENGFGYDPIFFLPEYGCTSAEISPEEKNRISHRGKALRAMRLRLLSILDEQQEGSL
jgi:XTP/dITP diphosphohydrolase